MTMKNGMYAATAAALMASAVPAAAQDAAPTMQDELAAMRAQMDAMAQRIATLEAELEDTQAVQEAQAAQAAIPAPVPVAAAAPDADPDIEIAFKGAPEITGKGGWSFKPRGRLNIDAGFVNAPDSTGVDDGFGSEMRRARLGVEGDIPGGFGYKFEVDVAGNEVELTDAILTYGTGGLTVSVGQHNNFQSMAELTSSRHSSFIERAAFTDAFGFERKMGVSLQYGAGDLLLQGGVFTDNQADLPNKNVSFDGRAVFMPKLAGGTQLHLGASVHHAENESGSTVRYRQRPQVHFTSARFVNTGNLPAESETGFGLEAAAIAGRLHVAGEGYWQSANLLGPAQDPTFFGGFAEVGYFLTSGDKRGYKNGVFDRVKPANPVGEGGIGAVQLVLRYDHLDLNDAGIIGGTQSGILAGLNWSPTDYTRFILSYAMLDIDDAAIPAAGGDTSYSVDSLGLRAQIDF